MRAFQYSRWDGTQKGFEFGADDLLDALTDDLVHHGDINAAMRQLMLDGFSDVNGERLQGLREMLERLRQQRQERLDKFDLGGVYDDIADELREVVETERRALDDLAESARQSGDERRQELTDATVAGKHMELDMLPPDLAGQMKGLEQYDFLSNDARQRFEELTQKLREQLMQQYVNQMAGAMQDMSPQDMSRMKDMLAALNEMLEQRQRGEEPDFDRFMQQYGDFFPENPQNLDELLEIMARRMAAAQAMLNSMTPEQRAQLQQLSDQLLEDMDLRWQVDQLSSNLQQMFPDAGWQQSYQFGGMDPLDMAEASALMQELGDIDQLSNLLSAPANPGALAEVDVEKATELLGEDAARSLEKLSELAKMMEDAGLIDRKEGRYQLTPRGIRRVAQNALADLFRRLDADRFGRHDLEKSGAGHERDYVTKPYEFGDPFNLHIERTVRNAVRRSGGGTPVRLTPDDFEVERTEHIVKSSTVLMLDLSLSMEMRSQFRAAKKVVMALYALITSQYPRDFLGLVGFGKLARELTPEQLPEVSWDLDMGTNMQHAMMLSRRMLARQDGTKQIIMITDGEPTAHIPPGSDIPFFSYPPDIATIEATMREVYRCTRDGIRINTFMLDPNQYLKDFVERITRVNRGRAFFTTPETLGDYVLVDFLEHKREMRTRGSRRAG